jgi:hypothetical protein
MLIITLPRAASLTARLVFLALVLVDHPQELEHHPQAHPLLGAGLAAAVAVDLAESTES